MPRAYRPRFSTMVLQADIRRLPGVTSVFSYRDHYGRGRIRILMTIIADGDKDFSVAEARRWLAMKGKS